MPTKLTTEQFIVKAKSVWDGVYNYSSVEYQGTEQGWSNRAGYQTVYG